MPAAKEDCSYKRCQRGPQQTRINEVYVQKIQRIAVRCSGLHRLGQSSQATQHSMTSHVRPSWDLKLPLLHFIRQGHSLWAPLLKRFGTWNMPTRQQKKTGWSCCTHWPSQNSKESMKNQNNLLTVWTTLQQKLHGKLMDVPWCRWPSLNATENRRWDFPSPPSPSATWFSWASPVEHESSMHGVLFPVVFAPEHLRILLIHYSILYQIVLVRFNVSILKQVDVHLVKVNEQKNMTLNFE